MDAPPADWWGLQATVRRLHAAATSSGSAGRCASTDRWLGGRVSDHGPWRISDCFHVGSYFLALRSEVIADPEFRRRLDTVAAQTDKNSIIRKYEIGISPLPDPGRLPARHLRRRRAALPPRLPRVGVRPAGRGLPAAQAPVPVREPVRRPRPARSGRSACSTPYPTPTSTRWSATCCGSRRRATCTAASRRPHAAERHRRRCPSRSGPTTSTTRSAGCPSFDHWWAFPVDPGHPAPRGQRPRGLRGGPPRPLDQEGADRASGTRPASAAPTWPRPDGDAGRTVLPAAGRARSSSPQGPRADVAHPLSGDTHQFVGLRPRHARCWPFGAAVPVGDGRRRAPAPQRARSTTST